MTNRFRAAIKLVIFVSLLTPPACQKEKGYADESYLRKVLEHRAEKDSYMRGDPNSPFNSRSKIEFHPLKYYDIDPKMRFESKLTEYPGKDTILIYGTKGEERETVRYGYLEVYLENVKHRINVYKSAGKDGSFYYSIWFTDRTTGSGSYGVGRYLDFELKNDPEYVYNLDFNYAYNPYCSYSPDYSCAIPTKEDYLDFAVTAGEKTFH
jgi:uncharacterized protein (DUF1684 family)